jgi:hypothetical protein
MMKRWIIAVCIAAPACQASDLQTSAVEQAATACVPGGNYPYAKLPKMYLWGGKTPQAKPGQLYIDYAHPVYKGYHAAFIADPGQGVLVWGAYVPDKDMPLYRKSTLGDEPRIGDCCRPPPPPPGGGDDWLARYTLEAALRFAGVPDDALVAADDKP